ncbi:MAG: metalloregulator ArsR/SmtB family transcription factor [Clostridia bacterium]|jgi:ArsR family transcriptional regulator|nr:metalloregulator ArsR/SmtB family transcription factor [Clostridia bacterium]
MFEQYKEIAEICKALSDSNRLMILDMLSEDELCACKILEKFQITQPTLSHHMKSLCQCGLVESHKVGKWTHYNINQAKFKEFYAVLMAMTSFKQPQKPEGGNCKCKP